MRDKLAKEKELKMTQLNEFLRQDLYDKKYGKSLIPKQTAESQVKNEPIQKIFKTETLRRTELVNRTYMPGKEKHV